jgi:hypothetical protein
VAAVSFSAAASGRLDSRAISKMDKFFMAYS